MNQNHDEQNMKKLGTLMAVLAAAVFLPAFLFGIIRFFTAKGVEVPIAPFPFFIGIFPLIFLAIWISIVVWVFRDAEARGMNGVLWAILTFIGNVVGLVVYLLVRSDDLRQMRLSGSTACPACKTPVQTGFAFCPQCGEKLQSQCRQCGEAVVPGWKVCPHCGSTLS